VTADVDLVVLDGDGQAAAAGDACSALRRQRPRAFGPPRAEDGVSWAGGLKATCPRCGRKGRLAAGADADIVVFDPAAITDQATYSASIRTRRASGTSWSTAPSPSATRSSSV